MGNRYVFKYQDASGKGRTFTVFAFTLMEAEAEWDNNADKLNAQHLVSVTKHYC